MDSTIILDTAELLAAVDLLPPPPDAFLRRYAPTVKQFNGKYIFLDKISRGRRIAPLVSPNVPGKHTPRTGRTLEMIEPAYIKDTKPIEPGESTERAYGEPIGGDGRSGGDRIADAIVVELTENRNAWIRRLEWMAANVLAAGKLVLVGDQYPSTTVDFKRNSALKIANRTSTNAWSHANAKPIDDLRAWAALTLKHGKAGASDVVMGATAFGKFISHSTVVGRYQAAQPTNLSLTPQVPVAEGLTLQGFCEGMNIFTYTGWFEDPANAGTETVMWADDAVAVTAPNWMVQAFAAIKDGKAGYNPIPFFPKMWENDDPADVILQTQSAPLLVPTNVDMACVCLDIDA